MNIFFVLRLPDGRRELITPPLSRGDILPGVTRRSILEMAQGWEDCVVNERLITMPEIARAAKEGTLLEAFGAGTAAVVAPVKEIEYLGELLCTASGDTSAGEIAQRVWDTMLDIQYGRTPHPWSWAV
mmetsp:Transcript_17398/g.59095  ORF Transcript_17398/g.59095 Transcript_17398/m.59095 type:complete len:128 (+) Transcript_17398:1-384(+)